MSDISASLILSHKEAASRASTHLSKTRNLKLSSVESLELVARTLGVANWPTLHAMALKGLGPRLEGPTAPVAVKPEKTAAELLQDYYGTDTSGGNCPHYPRSVWRAAVEDDEVLLGYWQSAAQYFDESGRMLPWAREANKFVKEAMSRGFSVVHGSEYEHCQDDDEKTQWFLVDWAGDARFDPVSTEAKAWALFAKIRDNPEPSVRSIVPAPAPVIVAECEHEWAWHHPTVSGLGKYLCRKCFARKEYEHWTMQKPSKGIKL